MIKLLNILSELEVRKKDLYEPFREYIRNGSKGDFNIRDNYTEEELKDITKVPKWFTKVGGDLHLFNSSITSLPENLVVRGDLDLMYTPIISLPNNLKVGGDLHLFNSSITSLPDNLKVGGDLDLSYSPTTSLPNNLKVGGSFYIDNTPLALLYDLNTIRRMIEEKGGRVGEVIT